MKYPDHIRTQRFLCVLAYTTAKGVERTYSCVVDAMAADLAIAIAERRLRSDKRRSVAAIPYGEARLAAPAPIVGPCKSSTAFDDQYEGEPA